MTGSKQIFAVTITLEWRLFDQQMDRTVYKNVNKDRPEQRLCLDCRG